jgi:MFS family permease
MIAQQQSAVATSASTWFSFLNRERTVARPGYSRWLIPPAALCTHLCIGQAYAFSVFNLPMTKLIGVTQATPADWSLTDLGWIFSLAIFFLGFSAALSGRWVEEGGPRRAMFTAALCWSGGFFLSAIGVFLHSLWLIYLHAANGILDHACGPLGLAVILQLGVAYFAAPAIRSLSKTAPLPLRCFDLDQCI